MISKENLDELVRTVRDIQDELLKRYNGKKINHWRPVFFPILKNYYFLTERISPICYRDDFRRQLIDEDTENEIISILDTCGEYPLFIMCSNDKKYYEIREKILRKQWEVESLTKKIGTPVISKGEYDIQTEHFSHSVSIKKRFGINEFDEKYLKFQKIFRMQSGFDEFVSMIDEILNSIDRYCCSSENFFDFLREVKENKREEINTLIEDYYREITTKIPKDHISPYQKRDELRWWFKLIEVYKFKFSKFVLFVPVLIPTILNYVIIRFSPKFKEQQEKLEQEIMAQFRHESIMDVFEIKAAASEYIIIMHADSLFEFFERVHYMF
ncbi:MAG: hypothetical protein ACTSQI_21210, partial [Candidatus Helarchaeota archaeon]